MYITQTLHRAVQQHPNGVATRCAHRKCSFSELHERVARLAGALVTLGIRAAIVLRYWRSIPIPTW